MENGAGGLVEVSLARPTRQLPPWLPPRMAVGANIPAPEPAVIGAIVIRTELP